MNVKDEWWWLQTGPVSLGNKTLICCKWPCLHFRRYSVGQGIFSRLLASWLSLITSHRPRQKGRLQTDSEETAIKYSYELPIGNSIYTRIIAVEFQMRFKWTRSGLHLHLDSERRHLVRSKAQNIHHWPIDPHFCFYHPPFRPWTMIQ